MEFGCWRRGREKKPDAAQCSLLISPLLPCPCGTGTATSMRDCCDGSHAPNMPRLLRQPMPRVFRKFGCILALLSAYNSWSESHAAEVWLTCLCSVMHDGFCRIRALSDECKGVPTSQPDFWPRIDERGSDFSHCYCFTATALVYINSAEPAFLMSAATCHAVSQRLLNKCPFGRLQELYFLRLQPHRTAIGQVDLEDALPRQTALAVPPV